MSEGFTELRTGIYIEQFANIMKMSPVVGCPNVKRCVRWSGGLRLSFRAHFHSLSFPAD